MSNLCIAVKTAENKLEQTAQANNVATALKLALLQKQAEQGLGFNTKEIIEESGEWTAPVTGTYRVTLIGGGNGGAAVLVSSSVMGMFGGASGKYKQEFVFLNKGQTVPVVIGAGGLAELSNFGSTSRLGGETSFGEITTEDAPRFADYKNTIAYPASYSIDNNGQGLGGGEVYGGGLNATWYGGGGGSNYNLSDHGGYAGNGHSGCVIAEWHDPEKVSLPTINDTDLVPYINLLQRLEAIEAQLNINS